MYHNVIQPRFNFHDVNYVTYYSRPSLTCSWHSWLRTLKEGHFTLSSDDIVPLTKVMCCIHVYQLYTIYFTEVNNIMIILSMTIIARILEGWTHIKISKWTDGISWRYHRDICKKWGMGSSLGLSMSSANPGCFHSMPYIQLNMHQCDSRDIATGNQCAHCWYHIWYDVVATPLINLFLTQLAENFERPFYAEQWWKNSY